MRVHVFLASACATAGALLPAQGNLSLVTSPDAIIVLKNNAAPNALGFIDDNESIITTPSATAQTDARPFWTITGINVMHGDNDGDGNLTDSDPLGDLNCLLVRRRPPHGPVGPYDPADLFIAQDFTTSTFVATPAGVLPTNDGDVYRARNGNLEFFVTESLLQSAFGGGNFDVDAMAQDDQGNLYLSFLVTTTVGANTWEDGAILHIPASAITYDAAGLITAVAANSAQAIAAEVDISSFAQNSGALNISGATITTVFDISGLEIDPNGGTWQSPLNGQFYPNLLFCSNTTSHFDNIWSTNNGGELAVINGKTMGYLTGPADGSVLGIGLLPSGQDAISGLALIPEQNYWIAIDSPQAGIPVGGAFDVEIGRVQPGSVVGLFLSLWNNDMPGGWVTGIPNPLASIGGNSLIELDLATLFAFPALVADSAGYASITLPGTAAVPAGTDLLLQAVGLPFGGSGFNLSATSNITF